MSTERIITNPFPGLRPFETEEYRLFFGREGQSDALVERLERSRFLAVVGTSGSGKSSLVRAGLLPALRGGMMAGAGAGWRVAVIRPGHDPVGNLAHALADKDVLAEAGAGLPQAEAEALIEATLRRGSLGLVEAARQARLGEKGKLLVVVDQFEELFRFRAARVAATEGSATDDDAAAFVKLLLEAARQREVPLYVVLTMRSDFLGDCAQFQGLPEAINDGQYLIPRMTRDERRFAITGPVRVARARMSEPLVNRLLNDVGDNPDQLPILQHALMRTWDYWSAHRRDGEPIGIEHYEAVGTMSNALSKHADEAWSELPDERSRQVAEVLFKALTERGADNREIRRPTRLREICEIAGASTEEVARVVEVFRLEGRSFLMPPAGVALEPDTVVDISHESLIRNWERLREWARDEAEAARIYRRLAGSATDYREGQGGLLDDVTLRWVMKWRDRYSPNHAWGMRYHPEYDDSLAYLEESRAASEKRNADAKERDERELEQARAFAEQQSRAARRLRRLTVALCLILLAALGTAVYALHARADAKWNEHEAQKNLKLAQQNADRVTLLANDLQKSYDDVKTANEGIEQGRLEAVALQHKAEAEEHRAETEQKRAQAEEARANEQARIASERAQAEKKAREEAVSARATELFARETNQNFRHGSAYRQQGNVNRAEKEFLAAAEGFVKLKNPDGLADTYFALGELSLEPEPDREESEQDRAAREDRAIKYFDTAAATYRNYPNPNPEAAGQSLVKLGEFLSTPRHRPQGHADQLTEEQLKENDLWARKGAARFEAALADFEAAGDKDKAYDMLSKLSEFYSKSKSEADRRKAIWAYEKQAASTFGKEHDPQRRTMLVEIAKLHFLLKEKAQADEYVKRALAIPESAEETFDPADLLTDMAQFLAVELNDNDGARVYLDAAAKITPKNDDPSAQADAQAALFIKVGKDFGSLIKDEQAAVAYFEKAAQVYRQRGDGEGEAKALGDVADWFAMGCDSGGEGDATASATKLKCDRAVEYLRRKLVIYQRAGDRGQQAAALSSIANVYEQSGEKPKALDAYNEALALALPSEGSQRATMLRKIVKVQMASGENQQALETYKTMLSLYEATGDENSQALIYKEIGELQAKLNQPQQAIDSYQRALLIFDRNRGIASAISPISPISFIPQVQRAMYEVYRQMKRQQPKP
ncbi:MAG: hypothetical protein QOJ70_1932 [Acidobacteriota bacterium]|nr:hypothetical protein [Acidobacteriota bacterium]